MDEDLSAPVPMALDVHLRNSVCTLIFRTVHVVISYTSYLVSDSLNETRLPPMLLNSHKIGIGTVINIL